MFPDLDGVSFALFHVEQVREVDVPRVRWRLADPALPECYRRWNFVENYERLHVVRPPRALSEVEVEWFDSSVQYGEWRKAALLCLRQGSARFLVKAKVEIAAREGFTAVAPMAPFGVGAFRFPATFLRAGEEAEVVARQEGLCIANLLLDPLVFRPADPAVEVVNLTPVLNGWEILPPGPVVLQRNSNPPGNYFAATGERVEIPAEPLPAA